MPETPSLQTCTRPERRRSALKFTVNRGIGSISRSRASTRPPKRQSKNPPNFACPIDNCGGVCKEQGQGAELGFNPFARLIAGWKDRTVSDSTMENQLA